MKSFIPALLLMVIAFLSGCKDKDAPLKHYNIQGLAQKGPFVSGSDITVIELDENSEPTGKTFNTTTLNDLGEFSVSSELVSSRVDITAEGYYFREVEGSVSKDRITLRAIVDLDVNANVNINVLTTMTRSRILSLVKNGMDFGSAKTKAETELLAAFGATSVSNFETLDIKSNALLLGVSTGLQGERSVADMTLLLNQIASELEGSGTVSASSIDKLGESALLINTDEVKQHLKDRFASLGVSVTIPDFEDVLALFLIGKNALPVVTGFQPAEGTFGDIVTITGSNFNIQPGSIQVLFDQYPATIVDASPTMLKVTVPESIQLKANKIKVVAKGRVAVSSSDFIIISPTFTVATDKKYYVGEYVSITGSGFNPMQNATKVSVDGKNVQIADVTKTSLSFKVPNDVYQDREIDIVVKVGDQAATGNAQISGWIGISSLPGTTSMFGKINLAGFAIGNKGYAGLGDAGNMWVFDPAMSKWSEIASYPGTRTSRPLSFVIDGKAYVGSAQDRFWRYDPSANTWTQVGNLTADGTAVAAFASNGKGYLVLDGASMNFWEYDPASDQWAAKDDKPGLPADSGFEINGKLYVFSSPTIVKSAELWKYDPSMPGWTQKSSPDMPPDPNLNSQGTTFAINGHGYLQSGQALWRYDADNDVWSPLRGEPVNNIKRGFAFVIGNKAFLGSGQFQANTSFLYEYDSTLE